VIDPMPPIPGGKSSDPSGEAHHGLQRGPGRYGASSASSIRATPAALKGVAARTRESAALVQALR
jgi:hypothetical protein